MKTTKQYLIAGGLALSIGAGLVAQEAVPPAEAAPESPTPSKREERREAKQAERKADRRATKAANVVKAPAGESPAALPVVVAPPAAAPKPAAGEERKLRLNFRGVPLDMVLNYLSEAAGYIILLETPVKGTVDVWSNEPLTKREAVELLNTVLNKNGYAAVQNDRMLTIVAKDEAKKRSLPVVVGSEPSSIPKSDQMVTQILPVKYISASQLIRDLQPLLPTTAVITANDGGNSLVITDTQASIRRVAEIVAALDTAQAGNSGIRVFPLKYADAKALATTIRELFQDVGRTSNNSSSSSSRTSRSSSGGPPGAGGGDPRAMFAQMMAARSGGGSSGAGPVASTRVTAVADEHSNSLIISASEDMIPTIEAVIAAVDTDVQDLTELRVFTLKYSDPTEMAQLLNDLFATQSDSSRGGGIRFGGGFPGGGFPGGGFPGGGFPGGGRTTSSRTGSGGGTDSERQKLQGQVTAVADPRTSSVVVTAAKELMPQIAEMVLQLDSNPARKQKVFVYSLENANVQEVETVLRSLFETQNTRGTTGQQGVDALQNRANQASQQQGITGGFGGTGGGGGGLGGGGFR